MASKTTLLFIISLLALGYAQTQEDPVVHLTQSNFSSVTAGNDFIVLFFSPYCGHCIHFKPAWVDFAKEVLGTIGVGDVDCTKEHFLEGQFSIRGYPTVFLLKDGNKYEFHGERSVQGLKDFIKDGYLKAPKSSAPVLPGSAGATKPDQSAGAAKPNQSAGVAKPDQSAGAAKPDQSAGVAKPDQRKTNMTEFLEVMKTKDINPNATKSTTSNDIWLKFIIAGTILLSIGLILLYCDYVKQNDGSRKWETEQIEDDPEKETEEDSTHDSSRIHEKPGVEVEMYENI